MAEEMLPTCEKYIASLLYIHRICEKKCRQASVSLYSISLAMEVYSQEYKLGDRVARGRR
jgi:hypothetical protein